MKHISLLKKILLIAFLTFSNKLIAQPGPLAIGTIHAGDSIIVKYDVTINLILVPPTTTYIANRGTVTANGGISLLTDDPDTAPNDSAFTVLNMFPLPVTLTNLRAYEKNNDIELAWKVVSEIDVDNYEIEKSDNGRTFTPIGAVPATGGIGALNYIYLDMNPFAGDNFYRLRIIDIDGRYKYSMIVKVVVGKDGQILVIYPNPVADRMINVQLNNFTKGRYEFNLYNSAGQIVYTRSINHGGGSASEVITLPSSISRGIYYANIKNGNTSFSRMLMIE